MNEIEERLFLALDAIEKLAEQAQKQQLIVDAQQQTIQKQQDDIVTVSCDKINEINLSQDAFNKLISDATYRAVNNSISKDAKNNVTQAMYEVTEDVAQEFVDAINKSINLINTASANKVKNDDAVSLIMKANIDKATKLSLKIEEQKEAFASKHYKMITLFMSSMFIAMCVFFVVVYFVVVPTNTELQQLRIKKIQLTEDNERLLIQKNNLVNYAKNNTR